MSFESSIFVKNPPKLVVETDEAEEYLPINPIRRTEPYDIILLYGLAGFVGKEFFPLPINFVLEVIFYSLTLSKIVSLFYVPNWTREILLALVFSDSFAFFNPRWSIILGIVKDIYVGEGTTCTMDYSLYTGSLLTSSGLRVISHVWNQIFDGFIFDAFFLSIVYSRFAWNNRKHLSKIHLIVSILYLFFGSY